MITIFSTPKNFEGIFDTIQTNAINSWRALGDNIEIIIFGSSKGAKEIAEKVGAIYIPNVKSSKNGVPYLSDLFKKADVLSSFQILTFINADIILPANFLKPILEVDKKFNKFLMVGYRWDLEIKKKIDFQDIKSVKKFWINKKKIAKKQTCSYIDYFTFRKNTYSSLPDFIIGRPGYDNWMIWHSRRRFIPVIDASDEIKVFHQNHDYNFHNLKRDPKIYLEEDGLENQRLISGNTLNLLDSNYEFKTGKIRRKKSHDFYNRNLGKLALIWPEFSFILILYKKIIRRLKTIDENIFLSF